MSSSKTRLSLSLDRSREPSPIQPPYGLEALNQTSILRRYPLRETLLSSLSIVGFIVAADGLRCHVKQFASLSPQLPLRAVFQAKINLRIHGCHPEETRDFLILYFNSQAINRTQHSMKPFPVRTLTLLTLVLLLIIVPFCLYGSSVNAATSRLIAQAEAYPPHDRRAADAFAGGRHSYARSAKPGQHRLRADARLSRRHPSLVPRHDA